MNKPVKTTKILLIIALVTSLTLNIITLALLKNQSDRINLITDKIDLITNLANEINTKVLHTQNNVTQVETKDIMTPTELAKYLNVDVKELYRLCIDDPYPSLQLPFISINGEIRFSKKAVDEFIGSGVKIFE